MTRPHLTSYSHVLQSCLFFLLSVFLLGPEPYRKLGGPKFVWGGPGTPVGTMGGLST